MGRTPLDADDVVRARLRDFQDSARWVGRSVRFKIFDAHELILGALGTAALAAGFEKKAMLERQYVKRKN